MEICRNGLDEQILWEYGKGDIMYISFDRHHIAWPGALIGESSMKSDDILVSSGGLLTPVFYRRLNRKTK